MESIEPDADTDTTAFPEKGREAWLVVLGAWCAMLPPMGLLNSLGTLHAWTSSNQLHGYSDSSIGWIYGGYGFFLYLAGAQAGPIFDSYGPSYVVIPGSIGMVASIFFFSFSTVLRTEYYQIFLSFSVLGGLSACALFTPAISIIGHWFNVRRGFATGIACTAGGLGGVLFPLIVMFAAPVIGFGWALRIIALLSIISLSLACLLIRTRLPLSKEPSSAVDFGALISDPHYAATTAAVFLVEFAVFIPITYISSYAVHMGFNKTLSYALIPILNLGAVPGRFLPGLLADRLGRFNVMIITSLICSILTLALWLPIIGRNNTAGIICYAALFGFWSGAAISLTPVCISQICRVEDIGKRNGTTFTVSSIGTLTGIPIAGAILQASRGHGEQQQQQLEHYYYGGLIAFGGAMYFAATLAFIVARGVCAGWRWSVIF
ncbi:hypothetical protein FQN55_000916 [Onygenales sp. PD_40]|nr:hypothetical protein FQN55_000916 [Onygenales sp. PD_40]